MQDQAKSPVTEAMTHRTVKDGSGSFDVLSIPVWLHATESFYKKLNRIAKQCGLSRYEAPRRGLDSLLREHQIQTSPLNKAIRSPGQSEVFRRTMGHG